MNVVIIEDEMPAYRRLAKLVEELLPSAAIVAHLDSVADAKQWFGANKAPDIVFMDVHLADGSAFDLLKLTKIDAPIVFTTAYDQYAIDAFKASSIDYLMKPIKKDELKSAIDKLGEFKKIFNEKSQVLEQALNSPEYKRRFIIRFGEHIKTLEAEDIAYCYSENKGTMARTFEGRNYPMDHNLDALQSMLDPKTFFRLNRQYLINIKAIADMRTHTKARVIVSLKPPVKEDPVVSSERAADFKKWLADEHL
ncbi:MAG TPA: LytTR family DNA-binding domain-containing protein [Flavipsychrobacter sp.]|jgi:DNA-binding LytR/AlgR family response regulator|nr:response regulator transcription factor [Chitinophagales bacterium]HLO71497.1 LytTR family DNA-binding domain-containing protein [Flavipsychrobacter sp.]